MALYQDGILISGANTLPKMTLAEYNALPADQRPTYWERLDADYDDILAEKSNIATVESGTTASRAYSTGELLYYNGTLHKAKVPIASGATFTVGTNVEPTNVSNELKSAIYMDLPIDISSYTQSNPYIAPSDGYAYLGVASGGNGLMWIRGADGSGVVAMGGVAGFWCCYVKKGMKIYATNSPSTARFASLY